MQTAWAYAMRRQAAAASPAMTVRGPAAATILFLKYLGYDPCPDKPWTWYCPGCPEADIDIAKDGRSDIDDAIGGSSHPGS